LQPSCGCCRVDALVQRHEGDAERLKQIASEAIKAPTDDDVHLTAVRGLQEFVQCRPAILRAGDAAVYELDRCPATGSDIAPEFGELVFGLLVER
jgi:hypothetical protein